MTRSGHPKPTLLARAIALAGLAAGITSALVFWGYCVDDALIPVTYAQHLAHGDGYVMSVGAAPSDGVTPLPFAFLLVPLVAGAGAWDGLLRAKALTVLVHGVVALLIARRITAMPRAARGRGVLFLLGLLLAVPSMAWAASGMEVELAALLVTIAVTIRRGPPWLPALLAGLAATLRPELGAFALGFALTRVVVLHGAAAKASVWMSTLAAAAGPFALVALVRVVWFGAAAPLSVAAKPSDASHGAVYLGAVLIASAAPFAVLSPVVLSGRDPGGRPIVLGVLMHLVAIVLVGGDSMPLARLMVPVVPALVVLAIDTAAEAKLTSVLLRAALVLAVDVFGLTHWAHAAQRTLADRGQLTTEAAPILAGSRAIACVDVGWVAAAAPHATLVDLAGVTDREIAYLPGGHTSKAISPSLLSARGVDTLLLLEKNGEPARNVEMRLLGESWVTDNFERKGVLAIGSTDLAYAVYKRRATSP